MGPPAVKQREPLQSVLLAGAALVVLLHVGPDRGVWQRFRLQPFSCPSEVQAFIFMVLLPAAAIGLGSWLMRRRFTPLAFMMTLVLSLGTLHLWQQLDTVHRHSAAMWHSRDPQTRAEDRRAALNAEAGTLGALATAFGGVVAGLTITYSVYSVVTQRRQEEHNQQENYTKELLTRFAELPDVVNGNRIFEACSLESTYLPIVTLRIGVLHGTQDLSYLQEMSRGGCGERAALFSGLQEMAVAVPYEELFLALRPDRQGVCFTHLQVLLFYSMDACLCQHAVVSRLHLENWLEGLHKEQEDRAFSRMELWWDAHDLPYVYRLLVFGSDAVTDTSDGGIDPCWLTDACRTELEKILDGMLAREEGRRSAASDLEERCRRFAAADLPVYAHDDGEAEGSVWVSNSALGYDCARIESARGLEDHLSQYPADPQHGGGRDRAYALRALTRLQVRRYIDLYYNEVLCIALILALSESGKEELQILKRIWFRKNEGNTAEKRSEGVSGAEAE
jgi:hypothetical protein